MNNYNEDFYKISVRGSSRGFDVGVFKTKAYVDKPYVCFIDEGLSTDSTTLYYMDRVIDNVVYETHPSVKIYTFDTNAIDDYVEEAKKHILKLYECRRSDLDDIIAACKKDMKGGIER